MKKFSMVTIVLIMSMIFGSMSFGAQVSVNNQSQNLTIENVDGRTYIHEDSLKAFGLSTTVNGRTITLSNSSVRLEFVSNTNAVKVNGVSMTLESKAFVRNGKAYLPMRFVFETMNYTVGYNGKIKQVTIDKNAEPSFPVTIKDGDQTYRFTKPVKSMVSLAPSITEILFAIGADDLIVGRTTYCNFPAQASLIRSVGTLKEPDVEGIIDIGPELVIAATHMNADAMAMFQKAGILIATQKSPSNIEQIYTLIGNLGTLTGKNFESRALISSLRAKEQRITNIANQIPNAQKQTTYYVVSTGKSEFTAGSDTFIHEVFTKAGAKNVAADVKGWSYSLEKLIEHNPRFIFGESWAKDIMTSGSQYAGLTALKNNRFVTVDGSLFSIPGPRVIDLGMKQIIETLYPSYAKQLHY